MLINTSITVDEDDLSIEEEDVSTFKTMLEEGSDLEEALLVVTDAKDSRANRFEFFGKQPKRYWQVRWSYPMKEDMARLAVFHFFVCHFGT